MEDETMMDALAGLVFWCVLFLAPAVVVLWRATRDE